MTKESDIATPVSIAREYFPDCADSDLEFLVWNRTGFPSLWPDADKTPEENFRSQLRKFKTALLRGTILCEMCTEDAINGQALCRRCDAAVARALSQWREQK